MKKAPARMSAGVLLSGRAGLSLSVTADGISLADILNDGEYIRRTLKNF